MHAPNKKLIHNCMTPTFFKPYTGYGDLSVEKDEYWKVIIGMLYMIVSILVALTALSAAAESAASPIKSLVKRIAKITPLRYPEGPLKENEYIYQRIRKVQAIMLCDVAFQFLMLNLVGIFASQIFIEYTEVDPDRQWDWIDSMYWAVQVSASFTGNCRIICMLVSVLFLTSFFFAIYSLGICLRSSRQLLQLVRLARVFSWRG